MEIQIKNAKELEKLAHEIANKLNPKDVLALYGNLGAGKTTFTRFLVNALGIEARVQSPTFVIFRHYTITLPKRESNKQSADTKNNVAKVHHVDLYRLTNIDEVLDLGLEEFVLPDFRISEADQSKYLLSEYPEYRPADIITKMAL